MSATILELQTKIEELEKRIKAISNAQTLHAELSSLTLYFEDIKELLEDVNEIVEDIAGDNDDQNSSISALADRVEALEDAIENIGDTVDTSSLENAISALESAVAAIKGGSDTSIASIEDDISAIESDIGDIKDDVDDVQDDISAINTNLGSMQTTLTNLSSTQNTLTTNQSNLSTTVNSMNSRVTNVENSILQLTNGVDLSAYDTRLKACENVTKNIKFFHFRNMPMDVTPLIYSINYNCLSKETYYSTAINAPTRESYKISYSSTGTGTVTVSLYADTVLKKTYTINLNGGSGEFCFDYDFISKTLSHSTGLTFTSTSPYTINSIYLSILGHNLMVFDRDPDLKVVAYNDNIYVTREYSDCVKCGKYALADKANININNLPITIPNSDSDYGGYIHTMYFPFLEGVTASTRVIEEDALIRFSIRNKVQIRSLDMTKQNPYSNVLNNFSSEIFPQNIYQSPQYSNLIYHTVISDVPYYFQCSSSGVSKVKVSNSSLALAMKIKNSAPILNNNIGPSSSVLTGADLFCLLMGEDDCYYLFRRNHSMTKITEGCTGNAIGYKQPDGTYHIYIQKGNNMEKYLLTYASSTYTPTYVSTIENCDFVQETLAGQYFKHGPSGWTLVTPTT